MGFVEAIRAGFNNYANFSGRATRPEYWWWFVFTWIVSVISNALDRWAHVGIESPSYAGYAVGLITGIVALALFIPSWRSWCGGSTTPTALAGSGCSSSSPSSGGSS